MASDCDSTQERRERSERSGSVQETVLSQLVHLFKRVEYMDFEVAHLQCRRLVRRSLLILMQVESSKDAVGHGLQTVLAAGLYILHECLGEESGDSYRVQKMLISFAYTHIFKHFYTALRKVWASRSPVWRGEDEQDQDMDVRAALHALGNADAWKDIAGSGDTWRLLRKLNEGPEAERAVIAKYKRHQAYLDFADITKKQLLSQNRYTTVSIADYRGTTVVVKEVHDKMVSLADPQNCMMHGTSWVPLHHPYIVPLVGCAVTKLGPDGAPSVCAAFATLYASGYSLEQLWCSNGKYPTNAQLLKIARQAAEALLYIALVNDDVPPAIHIPCLPLDNCMIDQHTGNLRIIPQIAATAKLPSRFSIPEQAKSPACYMVGLLMWCALSATLPIPAITENAAIKKVLENATWAPSPPKHVPSLIATVVRKGCAFKSESGFTRLEEMLVAIDTALDELSHAELAAPCTPEVKPIPLVDLYGTTEAPPPPMQNPIQPPEA